MREKFALAATVGTLALAAPELEGGGLSPLPPIVNVVTASERPPAHRRVVLGERAQYLWLERWTLPPFFAEDRPVVKRPRSSPA